jgi:hypothetical protein
MSGIIYSKLGHVLFYTSMASEMKCSTSHTFVFHILFQLHFGDACLQYDEQWSSPSVANHATLTILSIA